MVVGAAEGGEEPPGGEKGRGRDDCEIANLVKRGGRGERGRQCKERACNLFKGVFAHY